MYKTRLKDWDVYKVVRQQDVAALSEQMDKHRATYNASPTLVEVNGRFVPKDRILRSLRRHRIRQQSKQGNTKSSTPDQFDPFTASRSHTNFNSPDTGCSYEDQLYGDSSLMTSASSRHHSEIVTLPSGSSESSDLVSTQTADGDGAMIRVLTALHVVMLQTDYHSQDLRLRRDFNEAIPDPWRNNLQFSGDLGDLDNIFVNFKQYHYRLQHERNRTVAGSYQCSPAEVAQAKNFYAQSWLSKKLLIARQWEVAFRLMRATTSQMHCILARNHPHFLPWMCFVICGLLDYPDVANSLFDFAGESSRLICGPCDERSVICDILQKSNCRRHLALRLLSWIIDDFRQRCGSKDMEQMELLAQLFDHVLNQQDQLRAQDVEPVLQQWASASLSIAEVVDRKEIDQLRAQGPHAVEVH